MSKKTLLTAFFTMLFLETTRCLPASAADEITSAEKVALAAKAKETALPLVCVETENGEKPTFTTVTSASGAQAINAEYVSGRVVIILKGDTVYDSGTYEKGVSGMRIKVRGNTSATLFEQTPYKLKLQKKADLLLRNDKSLRSKNWALLSVYLTNDNMETGKGNLQTVFGLELARHLGMEWEPSATFVNLVMNGEYAGLYNLTETVERETARVNVEDDGFVIENDAYWWNEDKSFRTPRQQDDAWMGFTFKYPDADDVTDEYLGQLLAYMTTVEEELENGDAPETYLDYKSFATWILAHDLLGSTDPAGTNIYFQKASFNAAGYTASPLKAGPLWDFGGTFKANDGAWSTQHTHSITYYPLLFKRTAFCEEYVRQFQKVKPTLLNAMRNYLETYGDENTAAFDASAVLQNSLISYDAARTFDEQKEEILQLLEKRIETLDGLISTTLSAGISTVATPRTSPLILSDILGRPLNASPNAPLPRGIYILRNAKGATKKVCR